MSGAGPLSHQVSYWPSFLYSRRLACQFDRLKALPFRRSISRTRKLNATPLSPTISPLKTSFGAKFSPSPSLDGSQSDIREKLRQWQLASDRKQQLGPSEMAVDVSNDTNFIVRPESSINIDSSTLIENRELSGNALEDLNRIVDYSEGVSLEHVLLRKGDLVSLRSRTGQSMLCTFLGLSATGCYQWYTSYGSLWFLERYNATFHSGSFFHPNELEPVLQFLPQNHRFADSGYPLESTPIVPRYLSASLLNKMAAFQREADAIYRDHAHRLDSAFELLAHPSRSRIMTFEGAINELTGPWNSVEEKTLPQLQYAISTALLNAPGISLDQKTFASTKLLQIDSKEHVKQIKGLQSSLRNLSDRHAHDAAGIKMTSFSNSKYQGFQGLLGFVSKCQELIRRSRKTRFSTPEGFVVRNSQLSFADQEQSAKADRSVTFDSSDAKWIQAVSAYVLTDQAVSGPNSESGYISKAILRATGLYPEHALDQNIAHMFLIEIGVFDPYTVPHAFDQLIRQRTPGLDLDLKCFKAAVNQKFPKDSFLYFDDSMSHFREDWGDLPVYCVDSADTVEVDDGISVEAVDSSLKELWLHVHVCHVSAFTEPDDCIGRCAESNVSTVYLMSGREPMLPLWISDTFSVGPGKPVLTFSARINTSGEILESRIRPGVVHNTVRITPSEFSKLLGCEVPQESFWSVSVGKLLKNDLAESEATTTLDPTQTVLLRQLYNIALKRRVQRPQLPFLPFDRRYKIKVQGIEKSTQALMSRLHTQARFSRKDPDIQIAINERSDHEIMADTNQGRSAGDVLVEECMLLANCTAADFAATRNIPLVFYGTRPVTTESKELEARLRESMKGLGNIWTDSVRSQILQKYASSLVASRPVESKITGFSRYTKVTSPLRRYFDLVSLWQIDKALREEHSRKQTLIGTNDTSYLPFKKKEIERIIRWGRHKEMKTRWYTGFEQKHIMTMALARAHYGKEAMLPSPLLGVVGRGRGDEQECYLSQLHMACRMKSTPGIEGTTPIQGERWEVEIDKIDPYSRKILVTPIKRVQS